MVFGFYKCKITLKVNFIVHVNVRVTHTASGGLGILLVADSLLTPRGSNAAHHQAWWQAILPAKPSHQLSFWILFNKK